MLTFTESDHAYYWRGQRVPNVTSIIAPLTDYSHIPPDRLQKLQDEGRAIHKMVELDCRDDLDAVPAWMAGHHKAWLSFKREAGLEVWDAEKRVYHERLGFAGTPDLAGLLKNLKDVRGPAIIDVKRSLYGGPAIGLQTAAYEEARNAREPKERRTSRRFALVLRADGTYHLTEYYDPGDRVAFLACLQQWQWRAKHYHNK